MAKFFSLTVKNPRKAIPNGSRIRIEHALRYDEYGNKYLAEVGTFDQYAYIQSFAASCDINEIVRRATPEQMAAFGQGVYGDVSNIPKTLADSYEILRNAEFVYDNLPADVKAEYADYKSFLNSFGTMQGLNEFVAKCTNNNVDVKASDAAQSTNEGGVNNEQKYEQ